MEVEVVGEGVGAVEEELEGDIFVHWLFIYLYCLVIPLQANLIFCSDGKRCGETLPIKIKIKEFNSQQNEIKENLDKINEFRDMFNLTEDEYPNERILETLQENDFNYEKAFSALFD